MLKNLPRSWICVILAVGLQQAAGSLQGDLLSLAQQIGLNTTESGFKGWTNPNSNPCTWTRVTCGQELINSTQLYSLDLSGLGLQGQLPDFEELPSAAAGIQSLNLSANNFTGVVPNYGAVDGQMEDLVELDLHGNNLHGAVPAGWNTTAQLGSLVPGGLVLKPGNPKLCEALTGRLLSLSNSSDTNAHVKLPTCGTQSDGELLLNFKASFENFDAVVASNGMYGWTNDTVSQPCSWDGVSCNSGSSGSMTVWLRFLGLSGTIDDSWQALGERCSAWDFDGNDITGQLQGNWGQALQSMYFISIAHTNISGSLPAEWGAPGAFPALYQLWLYGNAQLNGSLPAWDENSFPSLSLFSAEDCDLGGQLPASWGQLPALEAILLENNNFTGTLPPEWATLNAKYLQIPGSSITGQLPASWGQGQMPQLYVLDLSHNKLTGKIPAWGQDGGMAGVQFINLNDNALSGSVPKSLDSLSNLRVLDLADNGPFCGAVATQGNSANNVQAFSAAYGACTGGSLAPASSTTPASNPATGGRKLL